MNYDGDGNKVTFYTKDPRKLALGLSRQAAYQ